MAGHVWVTGDTHGADKIGSYYSVDGFIPRLSTRNFPRIKDMDKDDYVIILGDFGGIWGQSETEEEKYNLDWLEERHCSVLCVLGNHENYDRINALPQVKWSGGLVRTLRPHVRLLSRGQYYTIAGHTFFVMDGAASHDIHDGIVDPADYPNLRVALKEANRMYLENKEIRVKGVTWWSQETPTEEELEKGRNVLKEHGDKVDFILSHSPSYTERIAILGCRPQDPANRLELWLDEVMAEVEYKRHYFGHLHENITVNGKSVCLYGLIEQIC